MPTSCWLCQCSFLTSRLTASGFLRSLRLLNDMFLSKRASQLVRVKDVKGAPFCAKDGSWTSTLGLNFQGCFAVNLFILWWFRKTSETYHMISQSNSHILYAAQVGFDMAWYVWRKAMSTGVAWVLIWFLGSRVLGLANHVMWSLDSSVFLSNVSAHAVTMKGVFLSSGCGLSGWFVLLCCFQKAPLAGGEQTNERTNRPTNQQTNSTFSYFWVLHHAGWKKTTFRKYGFIIILIYIGFLVRKLKDDDFMGVWSYCRYIGIGLKMQQSEWKEDQTTFHTFSYILFHIYLYLRAFWRLLNT